MSVFDVQVDTYFADSLDVDRCRDLLVAALKSPDQRVMVDFNRKTLHQKGSGHFSPLAAFHASEDRVLLMDVARYKSPPCWVTATMLYHALTETDSVSQRSRGFLIVSRREAPARDSQT